MTPEIQPPTRLVQLNEVWGEVQNVPLRYILQD